MWILRWWLLGWWVSWFGGGTIDTQVSFSMSRYFLDMNYDPVVLWEICV